MSLETFEKLSEDKKELIISTGIREFAKASYKDVSTDSITQICNISKGILFHYFGSKKKYYLYCLEIALERLTAKTETITGNDFFEILFSGMNRKIAICAKYKDEMHMINMASRDASKEIVLEKSMLMKKYMENMQNESAQTLRKAIATLDFHSDRNMQITVEGLQIYINAVMNKYLMQYQQTPDAFFQNSEKIKEETKQYLEMILYGICK